MQPIQQICLHVGCGKTGSTALQVWLSQASKALEKQGVAYPLHAGKPLPDYAITGGNAWRLAKCIQEKKVAEYFSRWKKQFDQPIVLFSSENLQALTTDDWKYFTRFVTDLGAELKVIAYVRDVYDICYSSYVQLVKRNTFSDDFRGFACSQNDMQQFAVATKLRQAKMNTTMFHYDTVMSQGGSIARSLMEEIGVDCEKLPAQKATKVNRSLTLFETQFMRVANKHYKDLYTEPCHDFSKALSDQLINIDPELETEVFVDEVVIEHLQSKMQHRIDFVNKHFLPDTKLRLFEREGKRLSVERPEISEDFSRVIKVLIQPMLEEYNPSNSNAFQGKVGLPTFLKRFASLR